MQSKEFTKILNYLLPPHLDRSHYSHNDNNFFILIILIHLVKKKRSRLTSPPGLQEIFYILYCVLLHVMRPSSIKQIDQIFPWPTLL